MSFGGTFAARGPRGASGNPGIEGDDGDPGPPGPGVPIRSEATRTTDLTAAGTGYTLVLLAPPFTAAAGQPYNVSFQLSCDRSTNGIINVRYGVADNVGNPAEVSFAQLQAGSGVIANIRFQRQFTIFLPATRRPALWISSGSGLQSARVLAATFATTPPFHGASIEVSDRALSIA